MAASGVECLRSIRSEGTLGAMHRFIALFTVCFVCGGCAATNRKHTTPAPVTRVFVATAHSQVGQAASGEASRVGTVAADPKVLPLGSLILVTEAGRYSGRYKVIDTGPGVKGRRIDIYMASDREARRFGRRRVGVRVLRRGDGQRETGGSP